MRHFLAKTLKLSPPRGNNEGLMKTLDLTHVVRTFAQWFDSEHFDPAEINDGGDVDRINWLRTLPFVILHFGCLAVFWVGWSSVAVQTALVMYLVRMFAITGIYHRYFAHRTFRTSRWAQFAFAVLGASSAQRGPLWWAAHHRNHHRESDLQTDPHSPVQYGFLRSHAGWFMCNRYYATQYKRIQDFARFPELVWLNRFDKAVPFALGFALYLTGAWLERSAPSLGVTGLQLFVWGFVVSTTVLFHATASINSLAHLIGSRRYDTADQSRNNFLLALITLGEGWHNNHHQHMGCTRQGFYWWEIDFTYYVLKLMSWTGLIWDLKPVPARAYSPSEQLPIKKIASAA